MPKPTRRAPVRSPKSPKKAKAAPTARLAENAATPSPADEAAYLEMLVKTGQAVPAGRGKLPPGATHELVADAQGQVKAVRRRFSVA